MFQWEESSESDISDTEDSDVLGALDGPNALLRMSGSETALNDKPSTSSADGVGESNSRRQATRVFKKSSQNGKITVYLGKRDFVDHITHVDPIGKNVILSFL